MAENDNKELKPHYYRDNFLHLCDTVEAQYADLLAPAELLFLRRLCALDFKAQCLYVRLVSRVGPWFRESRLVYAELGPLVPVLDALIEQGMMVCCEELSLQEMDKLYTRLELQRAFSHHLQNRKFHDKPSLLSAIDALSLDAVHLLQQCNTLAVERVVAPLGLEYVQLLQLLFFGNRHQSLTEFVLSDLGVATYYPYQLDPGYRLFPGRRALDEYLVCAAFSDTRHELLDAGDLVGLRTLADDVLSTDIVHPSSEDRWCRLCNALARDCERQGEMDTALALYSMSRRHPARERRARVLERCEDWAAAVVLCDDILASPWCEDEREAAGRILPRVRRKLDGTRLPRPRDEFPELRLQLQPGSGPVELQAAAHLATNWQSVHYVENKLMNALFGLAFWEQIFAPVPGAFHNPYQSVPADMYDPAFRERRRELLQARLAQLREDDLAIVLPAAYRQYTPFQCRWVDWRRIDASIIEAAARIIPDGHLLAVWERMLFDPGENRRGFPDLIALGERVGDYCMIEVKGPGDVLQGSQKRWLRYFYTQGIPALVARVEWWAERRAD
jgi:hypothetical protein